MNKLKKMGGKCSQLGAYNVIKVNLEYRVKYYFLDLTLTRPIGLHPHTPVAQKIVDQRLIIPNLAKIVTFLYKMM